jgi:hypothetical protein
MKRFWFGLRYAGWYLQLYNVKPTLVCSVQAGRQVIYKSKGGTSKGIGILNSAFEKAGRLPEKNLTGSHFH